jgi:hypothetical protein
MRDRSMSPCCGIHKSKEQLVGSLSVWHWVVAIIMLASPILGVVRGVSNGSILHALLSIFIPVYGLIYFFAAKKPALL